MKEFDRTERVGAELQRVLSVVVRDEVRDPRLANITIQEVRVTRDLAHAKVFFSCFSGEDEATAQARLLNGRLAGFLRHALAQRVRLRAIPQLHFVFDTSIRHGEHLSALIDQAVATSAPSSPGTDLESQDDGLTP